MLYAFRHAARLLWIGFVIAAIQAMVFGVVLTLVANLFYWRDLNTLFSAIVQTTTIIFLPTFPYIVYKGFQGDAAERRKYGVDMRTLGKLSARELRAFWAERGEQKPYTPKPWWKLW